MDHLAAFGGVDSILARGDTKMSLRLTAGVQVDLRAVPAESFGAALQYFTGSKEHNIVLRGRAKSRGLKINEYGVFRGERADRRPHGRGRLRHAGSALFSARAARGPPRVRVGRRRRRCPNSIELADIRGDLHTHSTWTDGMASIEEMAAAAKQRGLKYIAITDHSKRVTMVGGLNGDQLRQQWAEIDELNKRLSGITVLKGVEVDILERGGLDLPDDVLAEADWVVASVHFGQQQSREQITGRVLDALQNPYVAAIAHPTGRMLLARKPYEIDMEAVMRAARDNGKMLELNAHPQAARPGRRGLRGGEELWDSHRDFDRFAPHGRAGRDALRRAAGPPRRPDEGRRRQHPHVAADQEDAGKEAGWLAVVRPVFRHIAADGRCRRAGSFLGTTRGEAAADDGRESRGRRSMRR